MNYFHYMGASRSHSAGVVTIYEYERGLLYRHGRLLRVLEAGRYRIWPFSGKRIQIVDARRASAQITNQKLLTADQITVTLNLVADYEVTDAATAVHKVADFRAQLYEDIQLAARNVVGSVTVDALLAERVAINARILESVVPLASDYGVWVANVAVKDVILAAKVRDLLMKEAETKRLAQAMLIGAREEVATLRALANAARLAERNPALLRLRELDTLRSFAQQGSNTVVVGVGNALPIPHGNGSGRSPASEDELPEDEE